MRLLVSVRDASEAAAALAGGADIIDAKEPAAGALGAVSLDVFAAIARTAGGARPLTAALGDAPPEAAAGSLAAAFVASGASLVKVGLAGCDEPRARAVLEAAARGAGAGHVIAVAYADHMKVQAPSPRAVLRLASAVGLAGVLMDTAHKTGPGLRGLIAAPALAAWVDSARRAGLLVALAGRLTADDVGVIAETDADIVGVRGAACDGGREGRVSADRVRALLERMSAVPAAGRPRV